MSNNNNQSTNNNTTNNKENNMISLQQVKALLENYKQVQQRGAGLQATLDNYQALQTQAEKNNKAIAKRMIEILTAIKTLEANNNSLQKAVEDKGNIQQVINSQKECFDILDEIEETMTSPANIKEGISIAENNESTVIKAEEKVTAPLPELKKPKFVRPIVKKAKEVAIAATVATAASTVAGVATIATPVATVDMVNNTEPQKQTVNTVEAVKEVKNTEPVEETVAPSVEAALSSQIEAINNAESINQVTSSFSDRIPSIRKLEKKIGTPDVDHVVHNVDGNTIYWRDEIFFNAKVVDRNEVADFIEHFVPGFETNIPYTLELHQQLLENVISSEEIQESPEVKDALDFVDYIVKEFYHLNMETELVFYNTFVARARNILEQRAYLLGATYAEPESVF